jgi:hypothetical protein
MPSTLQVGFVTEEVNCCVWVVTVTAARLGDTLTVTTGRADLASMGVFGVGLAAIAIATGGVLPLAVAVNAR